jgi:dihydroflavonol-4-reductase
MSATLVTGGTGFLGEHVVAALAARGTPELRVLVRGTYELQARPGVRYLRGDLVSDGDAGLLEAMHSCEEVYHLAGLVSRDPGSAAAMMRVHVEGTTRLLRAARRAGVRRVVVASSSGTVAVSRTPEPIPDEDAGYATELVSNWPYYLSKIYQEKVALELGTELGIEVVIVNPSLLLGPGDRRLSSTGDVLRFLRREIPIVPSGGLNFVDARDAAEATVMAMAAGRPGERYLLGGPNWSFAEFFGRLERASKVPAPRLRMPDRWARTGAALVEHLYRQLGREAPVDAISVEMSQVYWYCDSSRAARELGFAPRDPGETLDETIRYLRRTQRI